MKNSLTTRLSALLLAAALTLPLTSCKRDGQEPPSPPPIDTPQVPEPGPAPSPETPPEGGEPVVPDVPPVEVEDPHAAIQAETIVVDENTFRIDTSYFEGKNMTLDSVYICDNTSVLFFLSPLNDDGTVSERSLVYVYSLETSQFRKIDVELGVIGIYPDRTYDDGTVSVVTLNSETYDHEQIVFINPTTLECSFAQPPEGLDIVSLLISPDKSRVALTTFDYMQVTDLTFEPEYFRMDRETGDTEDELDDKMPSATAWSADGAQLLFKMVGWEFVYSPGMLDLSTSQVTFYDQLAGKGAEWAPDSGLFFYEWYVFTPFGFLSPEGIMREISLPEYINSSNITTLDLSPKARYIGLTYQESQDGVTLANCAYVADAQTGQPVATLRMEAGEQDAAYFAEFQFTPDERTALITTGATVYGPKEVYVFDFGR